MKSSVGQKIKILIADDHDVVREGVTALLSQLENVEIVAKAANGVDALRLARKLSPDLMILDLMMPGMTGHNVCVELQDEGIDFKVIFLTGLAPSSLLANAMRFGPSGAVLKEESNSEILKAVDQVLQGRRYISEKLKVLMATCENNRKSPSPRRKSLTRRERQILKLVGEGHSSKEIAHLLDISPRTVDNHRANLMLKLEARNALELVTLAHSMEQMEHGKENA